MNLPLVSVVVSIYNAEHTLRPSLASVLEQHDVPCEFILVDDGSTDGCLAVLDEVARCDARVRLLRQENRGLTQALIKGCAEARGEFIARHDADDLSLPGRLARQAELLVSDPRLAFVSCRTRMVGPEDELLLETNPALDAAEATAQLRNQSNGPCHGSVMFRAEAYRAAGGYRPHFRYAQDWDLWLRLSEIGQLRFAPEVLYAFRISAGSISSHRREQQRRLAEIAGRCCAARAAGCHEYNLLEEAARVSAEPGLSAIQTAAANAYFIGKCLLDRRDRRAVPYLWLSIRHAPSSWRSWAALMAALLLCGSPRT
jgi:glycosyltransferase involved in cell wall biosynthesis